MAKKDWHPDTRGARRTTKLWLWSLVIPVSIAFIIGLIVTFTR